jgi:predicted dienelactone hydrolase
MGGPFPVGYVVLQTKDQSRGRPILIDAWFPAAAETQEAPIQYNPGTGNAALNAEAAQGPFPTIVMSHGAMGSARNYSWIAEHLARSGYVVAGVSHYRESYAYGPDSVDPAAVLQPWLRPPDCSFALDFLISESRLGPAVDSSRIGALGHSSGGATVIALGGGVFDGLSMHKYCTSDEGRRDRGCDYARGASSPPASPAGPSRAFRDERVRAVVALDPALGPGHTEEGLAAIMVPVHIVGAVQNDFLPFDHNAGRYAQLIPGASLTRLNRGEGHFVFLNMCNTDLSVNGVPLCRDKAGVHRQSVHEYLARTIRSFLDTHLSAVQN